MSIFSKKFKLIILLITIFSLGIPTNTRGLQLQSRNLITMFMLGLGMKAVLSNWQESTKPEEKKKIAVKNLIDTFLILTLYTNLETTTLTAQESYKFVSNMLTAYKAGKGTTKLLKKIPEFAEIINWLLKLTVSAYSKPIITSATGDGVNTKALVPMDFFDTITTPSAEEINTDTINAENLEKFTSSLEIPEGEIYQLEKTAPTKLDSGAIDMFLTQNAGIHPTEIINSIIETLVSASQSELVFFIAGNFLAYSAYLTGYMLINLIIPVDTKNSQTLSDAIDISFIKEVDQGNLEKVIIKQTSSTIKALLRRAGIEEEKIKRLESGEKVEASTVSLMLKLKKLWKIFRES